MVTESILKIILGKKILLFFRFILTYFTDYNIVLNEKDLEWFRKIIRIRLYPNIIKTFCFKNFRKNFKTSSIKWIAGRLFES